MHLFKSVKQMANHRISKDKKALALAALAEGMAINSICRMFQIGKANLLRSLMEVSEACEDWHNRHFRGLEVARLEIDEQWAYVHTHKERMTPEQKMDHPDRGDCWLWAGIDADSKAIVAWRTGKRTGAAARDFLSDLAGRVPGRVQITSDQLEDYAPAVRSAFGDRADYAHEGKEFQAIRVDGHEWQKQRVNPLVKVERKAVFGQPNLKTATTSRIERYFLTVRQGNKRCARKTLAYSKKWDNHAACASIHAFIYNLVRRHESLKGRTPAQALGVADRRWTLEDVVEMTDKHLKAKDDAAFEAAFAATPRFNTEPTSRRVYEPQPVLTPWYLDKDSGGPNPEVRKPGIRYATEEVSTLEFPQ